MEKKALGKGISALIPDKEVLNAQKIIFLSLEQIRPNPLQPRELFKEEEMEELIQSIKEKGVIQPILVRRKGDFYELIAGERRFRAANILNLKEIPAIVKDVEDQDALEISLIENIQRQDLNPIEEARAYQYLIDKFNLTQERIGEVLGKSRASITNTLRLLQLPLEIQEEIKKGRLSFAHGRALLEVEDENRQRRLVQEIIARGLSVRELENIIRRSRSHRRAKTSSLAAISRPLEVAAMEELLQQILATKVRINKRKKRGTIVIEFYSPEELKRIVDRIKGATG